MDYNSVLEFLFSEKTMKAPQLGWAGKDKRAWLWLPGKTKKSGKKMLEIMKSAPIKGCTQLAFDEPFEQANQLDCEICWIGLDIDWDDNKDTDLAAWAVDFARRMQASMIRFSCSGIGIHMMWVLEKPVRCNNQTAGKIVKHIAQPFKEEAEKEGIHVCQANRRMFWLDGAKNATLLIANHKLKVKDVFGNFKQPKITTKRTASLQVSEKIMSWIEKFQEARVLAERVTEHNPIYIGYAVDFLRESGEKVYTKSNCSGNGNINGYIDISDTKISLWSYADGYTIWCFDDVEAILG